MSDMKGVGPNTQNRGKWLFALLVVVLILLNLGTFAEAIPETSAPDSGCCASGGVLAKDFSAYYTAAWRLFHDPSQIYFHGSLSDGEPAISPEPQGFKYLPSFLLLVSPFLSLPYQQALLAFDVFQFLLLPSIAVLVYVLLKDKGLAVTSVAAAAILLLPLPMPTPQWILSVSYYWQWAEGQSKVLLTFLLLSALALAKSGRPRAAGVVLGLGSFDPRFAALGLPLVAVYSLNLRSSIAYAAVTFGVTNLLLVYPPTLLGFLSMLFTTGLPTPPYYYSFIPVVALASLMLANREEMSLATERLFKALRP